MLEIILFILIGIKLNIMHGLYLGLIIVLIIAWSINFISRIVKICLEIKEEY